eukprot:360521-Chlamydomonas_euryale.AAC.3
MPAHAPHASDACRRPSARNARHAHAPVRSGQLDRVDAAVARRDGDAAGAVGGHRSELWRA